MKTGKTLTQLAMEIERQQHAKKDFIARTDSIGVVVDNNELKFDLGDRALPINDVAHGQVAEFAGIPKPYYDRMKREAPELLRSNVEEWFRKYPAPRMIRTLDDRARAFLSDRYRPLDNAELAEAVLPALLEAELEIVSSEITEKRIYIKAIDPKTQRFVPNGFRIGDGSHVGFKVPSGEICPAIQISNSEIGYGTLSVVGGYLDGGCTNLAWRWRDAGLKKYHIGSRVDVGDELYKVLSDETRRATDKAVWLQVRDTVKNALSVDGFDAYVETLKAAAGAPIEGDPVKVVEVTAKKFGFTDGQRTSVLQHLIRGGDLSQFGLANAVTSMANDQADYDDATSFETLGGRIIELPRNEWRELTKMAA